MDKADRPGHGCPAEQMIAETSVIGYNSGPTTELGLTLKSSNKCAEPELNNGSSGGASANAGSREEMVFVTADPLSELVWSPHKGLSLKCADCNIADKKTFLWGMVISPTQSITIGEGNDIGSSAGGNMNPSQIVQGFDCQVSDRVTVVGSPSSTRSILPICQNMEPTSILGSCEDVRDLTKDKQSAPYTNEEDHLYKRQKSVCGLTDLQSSEACEIRRNANSNNPEKASVPGLDKGNTADISSQNLNEKRPYSAEVNPKCYGSERESSCDHTYGKRKVGSRNGRNADNNSESTCRTSSSKQCELPDSPIRFLTSACDTHVIQDEGGNENTIAASNFRLERGGNTSENESGKSESASVELGVTSQPADHVTRNHCQIGELPEYDVILVEESPNTSRMPLHQRKGKEKVLSNCNANAALLKDDDDDSHESVESCNNSTGLVVARKRPWSFDQSLVTDSKRMKQVHEGPHCISVQRHGSSFMNWISNMVKGSSKSDLKETTSLDLIMRPSDHELGSDDMLQERNRQSINANTGFGTVFKALYHSNVQDTRVYSIDNQEQGSKELEMAIGTCDDKNPPVTCGEENVKFDNETGMSPENQMICGDGVGPSYIQNFPSANISTVPTDGKVSYLGSFFQNAVNSPSEEKETHTRGLSASNYLVNNIHPLGSQWITRFCPKVSSPALESSHFDQNIDEAVEGSTDSIRISPPAEAHSDVRNKVSQNCAVSTSGSFGLVRLNERTDHTVKPIANTIQPSQRLASVFARRLDALRHIMPCEVEGNSSHAVTTCIFCGIRGHKLQECSEITEAEFGALLKKLDFYDGAEESSCLCIRCFELNHWAIACPNISSRKLSHSNAGFSLLDFRNLGKTPSNKVTYKEDTDYRASTVANEKFTDIVILDKSNSDQELTKGKQTITSSSTENLSKEYQMTAFYNFVNRQIPAIPRGTFDAIKKLRLSRADIFKWKRSTLSALPLEGFFIRLRLRKLEKELGSTGYYVARISSGSREKSSVSSKILLSVKIGGFKCLVENRFVSNHEFLEDELLAWWCATLKVGGNLPSEKDLELKLNERKRFRF
ncbi:hypothetical protein ACHQM5_014471 [Ranunculus cassubicifolius]